MQDFLFTACMFVIALGMLVAVHEFGHYWVARKLGVKILRFSIGFGRPLFLRRFGVDQTEFVIGALPIGGFVRMLDERVDTVRPEAVHRAFNRQKVWKRLCIVLAGPAFNFGFAIFVYWLVFVIGVAGWKPVLGHVEPGSAADRAGLHSQLEITAIDGELTPIRDAVYQKAIIVLVDKNVLLITAKDAAGDQRDYRLDINEFDFDRDSKHILKKLGFNWYFVTPTTSTELMKGVQEYSAFGAIGPAVLKTWRMSVVTLKLLGMMLVGDISIKNISGPINIAVVVGQSAGLGLAYFLSVLAILSVSFGVLNLLPIPVLDGGHAMFHLLEMARGRPLSPRIEAMGQRVGLLLLMLVMSVAFYNDVA